MNGCAWGQNDYKIRCFFWDGKTDYKKVADDKNDLEERIEQFGDWLTGQTLPQEFEIKS